MLFSLSNVLINVLHSDDDDEDESEGGRRNKEAVQYSFKFVDYAPFVFYNIR